jgi:hypothetical protein
MGAEARTAAKPDAARIIAKLCFELGPKERAAA